VLRAYGDGKIFGEPYGEEPFQVVWLHGWGRRGADFAHCATLLAQSGVGSVALDLPGFGSSPSPTVAGGARAYAQALAPVVAQIATQPVVVVGHSFGGSVATVLSANNPELVRALVLTGVPRLVPSPPSTPALAFRVLRFLRAKGLVNEARMERARQRYGSPDYRASSGVMREVLVASLGENYQAELEQIRAPIYMVWGGRDTDVPVQRAIDAQGVVTSSSSLEVLDTIGHLVPTDAPEALVGVVREALA
jgi:pimeloyl-ACP methyl ester carboxylesterase